MSSGSGAVPGPAACGVAAKTSEFAIWAVMTPRYAAAWAAVRAAPSRTTTSVVTPTAGQCLADAGDGGVGEDRGTGLLGRPRRRGGHRRLVTRARHARTVMAVLASTGVFPSRRSGAYPA